MECNKDEAIRAKDIAVRKFTEKDFAGAKKFALKAQTLYPGLDGISQMLTTFDVHIAANNKVGGDMDMYGILGVNPLADDETIKKQYRKLVLLLHPDKNKSIGADGAFQFVSEAFSVLSDKAKRSAYNTKRHIKIAQRVPSQSGVSFGPANLRPFQPKHSTQSGVSVPQARTAYQKVPAQGGVSGTSRAAEETGRKPSSSASQQKVPSQSGVAAGPPGGNGYYKQSSDNSSRRKSKKTGTQDASSQSQSFFRKGDTFWTVCTRCKLQYEYMRGYLNKTLKCQNCSEGFVAKEVRPPSNLPPLRPEELHQQSFPSSVPCVSGLNDPLSGASAHWTPRSGTLYRRPPSSSAAHAQSTSGSQQVNESLKRAREDSQATGGWGRNNNLSFDLRGEGPSKRVKETDDDRFRSFGSGIPSHPWTGCIGAGLGNTHGSSKLCTEARRPNVSPGYGAKYHAKRELSLTELRNMLAGKALLEIREWNLARKEKAAAKEKEKFKVNERQKAKLAKSMKEARSNSDSSDNQLGSQFKKYPLAASAGDVKQEVPEFIVPDPDFHVFDLDRSECCFGENQVWVAYDNDDGMPRFYALIHGVISLNPFKVKMSWLNSKSTEFGTLDWVGRGFRKTCGDFKIGKHETTNLLNSFSHKVKWVKGPRGVIQIYPREGEIWALYRNWSPDWDQSTPDEVIHAYDMVEVLQDYNEETGVHVAPLLKAAGFRTVFCYQPNPKVVKHIPKQEMFRFSHQVPYYILSGAEKPNAPNGYVELDPAATPADLLQVSAATIEEQVTGLRGTVKPQSTNHQQ